MGELLLVREFKDKDIAKIITDLRGHGAASFPILREDARLRLVEEAKNCFLNPVERVAGGVIQEAEACQQFHQGSLFIALRDEFQDLLERSLVKYHPYPFRTPLYFDSLYLLRYPAGSIGITPHFDSPEYTNLTGGFILRGSSPFYICDDINKTNSRKLDTTCGNVILLASPGFIPKSNRQCHYLDGVTEERDSFWIRQSKFGGPYPKPIP